MNVDNIKSGSEFHYRCIGPEDPAAIYSPEYVLDTQVVSVLESMAVSGFDESNPNHCRGLSFLRRVAEGRGEVNTMLDHLEGSSFHKGALDSFNVVRRSAAVEVLLGLSRDDLTDFIGTGEPLLIPVKLRQGEVARKRVEVALSNMDWLFSPAYAIALLIRKCNARGSLDTLSGEMVSLSSKVPFVPDVPALSALLLQYGKPSLGSELKSGLFKLSASDGRKASHSAAWDLAHWGQVDLLDAGARYEGLTDQLPVLVTMDGRLALLADAIRRSAYVGRLQILDHYLRQGARSEVNRVRVSIAKNYAETPDGDTRSAYANVISELEQDLGFSPTEWSDPWNVRRLGADSEFIRGLLGVILEEPGRLLEALPKLADSAFDVVLSSIPIAELLLAVNAEAHGRYVEESLLAFFGPEKRNSQQLQDGERLILAASKHGGDELVFNAMVRELVIQPERIMGATVGILWTIRSIIADTASASGVSPERIVAILKQDNDTTTLPPARTTEL
jgi:hypothetical protein